MQDKFIQATSGWIPGIVLLLFATALVYGRPPAEIGDGPARSVSLPERIELTIDASLDLPARSVRIEFPAVVEQGDLR
jgi:hypothetical protein